MYRENSNKDLVLSNNYKRDILVFNTLKKYGFKVKNKERDFKISW